VLYFILIVLNIILNGNENSSQKSGTYTKFQVPNFQTPTIQ